MYCTVQLDIIVQKRSLLILSYKLRKWLITLTSVAANINLE